MEKRFIKDTSGAFQSLYTDKVSGLNFGILTQGRGKRRKNVWHIYNHEKGDKAFSKIVDSFQDAKQFLIKNYPMQPHISLPLKKGMYCHSEKESGFAHLGKIGNHYYIWGKNTKRPVAIVLGEKDDHEVAEQTAQAIVTAMNGTYGKNINPEKLSELILRVEHVTKNCSYANEYQRRLFEKMSEALKDTKYKTIS